MSSPFALEGMVELDQLRRTRDLDGQYPDLHTLAGVFGVTPEQANRALDALLGRTPQEAFANMVERFGPPHANAVRTARAVLAAGGGVSGVFKAFLSSLFREG